MTNLQRNALKFIAYQRLSCNVVQDKNFKIFICFTWNSSSYNQYPLIKRWMHGVKQHISGINTKLYVRCTLISFLYLSRNTYNLIWLLDASIDRPSPLCASVGSWNYYISVITVNNHIVRGATACFSISQRQASLNREMLINPLRCPAKVWE